MAGEGAGEEGDEVVVFVLLRGELWGSWAC